MRARLIRDWFAVRPGRVHGETIPEGTVLEGSFAADAVAAGAARELTDAPPADKAAPATRAGRPSGNK